MIGREGELRRALAELGRDPESRRTVVDACRALEARPESSPARIRDEVTGPIVDALHAHAGVVTKELANGLVLEFLYRSKIARDFVLAAQEKPHHVWEPQTTRLILHLARGARNVVVGGAYFGDQAALLAHALLRHGGVCHAFEPDADQAAMLARNAERNGLGNLRVNAIGLWDDDSVRLRLTGDDALASSAPADVDGSIAATTLDTYLDRAGVDEPELIVLDIEGAELAALRGARRRLELPQGRAPQLVFEVHRAHSDWSQGLARTEILLYLERLGYSSYAVRDFQSNRDLSGRPIELVPPETAYLDGPPHGFNVLATKQPALVEDGPFEISPGVSPKLLAHRDPVLHHPAGGL
jgi:FkbM family methyltransferase